MNESAKASTDEPGPSLELEALQFEQLIQIYISLGLARAAASAAAQADCLGSNIIAFRRRNVTKGNWFVFRAA